MYSIDKSDSLLREAGGRVYRGGPLVSLANSLGAQPWMLAAWGADILVTALLALLVIFKVKKHRRLFGSMGIELTRGD
jgi:hypothetical protein